MKSTAPLTTSQATRLTAFALALTTILGMPVSAKSVDSRNDNASERVMNHSAAARPAARPAAPARTNMARTNMARPAQSTTRAGAYASSSRVSARSSASASRSSAASRPTASRSVASRPNTARANTTRANTGRPSSARPNTTAHMSRPDARRPSAASQDHRAIANGSEHAARPGSSAMLHGSRPEFKNASFNRGHVENLHGGREIPQGRFQASFGREHQFHIGHPIMIGGQASLQFGGFWFGMVDPWPAAWLYTDPVYVDVVNGGYVLVNVAHPDVQVALSAGDPAPATCTAAAPDPAPAPAPVAVVRPVVPVTVAYTAPVHSYFTWHYWRPYWHHYWR